MFTNRIFLEQIDQSGASPNYVISWNGTAWVPAASGVADGDKGDITISGGVWTLDAAVVTLSKMANIAANSIIGNNTGSAATPVALNGTQITAMLAAYVGATSGANGTKGLVPAALIADKDKVLRGDATWLSLATVATSASATDLSTGTLSAALLPRFTGGDVTSAAAGTTTLTIGTGAVSLAKIATQATGTILGNNSGSTNSPTALTGTQITAMLDPATSTTHGLLTTTDFKKLQAVKQDYLARTLGTAVGDTQAICSITSTYAVVEIGINAGASNTKLYNVLLKNNATAGTWQRVLPYFTSGSSTDDYDLDVSISGTTANYRVRRTAGTGALTTSVSLRVLGDIGATITAVTSSQSAQTVAASYNPGGTFATQGRTSFTENAATSQKTVEVHNAATSNDTFMYLGMGYPTANDEEGILGLRKASTDYVNARITPTGMFLPLGAELGSTLKLKSFAASGAPTAATAGTGSLYYQTDGAAGLYISNGSTYTRVASWGNITGTLSDQTDLNNALNAKLASSAYTAADVLSKLLTVDGTGSGLDADLFDGLNTTSFLKRDDLVQNFNAFLSGGNGAAFKHFSSIITNRFLGRGPKIYVAIDGTENAGLETALFDGNFEGGVAVGTVSGPNVVMTVNVVTKGFAISTGVTYSDGFFSLHFYSGRAPTVLTARAKNKDGTWSPCTVTYDIWDGVSYCAWKISCPHYNYLTDLEVTMTPNSSQSLSLTELEYHGTRMNLDEGPLLTVGGGAFLGNITAPNLTGTNTGDQTITLSGDISGSGTGAITTAIGTNKVTLANLATVATATFLGRTTAATGNVEALTATQATALLNTFGTTAKGLVPAPATATGKYLKDDGTWSTVATGATSFIALTDTDPTTYAGNVGKAVVVNAGATGLDFTASALGSAAFTASTAYAASGHVHTISNVTGLQAALDAKLDDSQASVFGLSLLDDLDSETARTTLELGSAATADSAAFAAAIHTHAISDVIGLSGALAGKEPSISSGNTGQYWRGDKAWATLNPAAVLLGNVDNTSDANKPISTATGNALALKATIANPTFTGTVTLAADPVSPLQAATKQYVDAVAQGLDVKQSVMVATTANIALSGEQTIDGVLTSASRVLVKNQSTQSQNGLYVSSGGSWTRSTDMDIWAEVPGAFVFVESGTLGSDSGWVCTSNQGGTIGSTAINWTQFSGSGTFTASGGVTLNNTDFRLSDMVEATIKGRAASSGTGAPTDLTGAQVNTILPVFGASTKGVVPAPGASSGRYLKDDGTWAVVAGGAGGATWNGVITATGTGVAQTITLPESGLAPQDVLVFVDGIRWNVSEYTIVGTGLTLTTNLAGESVQIIKPTGSGGSTIHVPTVLTQNISGAVTLDCNGYDVLRLTLVGNVTSLTLTNLTDGKKMSIEVIQDATGGRTIAMSSQFKFGLDFPSYTATSTALKRDLVGIWVTGTDAYVVGISRGY